MRKHFGLSSSAVAKNANISKGLISKIESDKSPNPSLKTITAIAECFGVNAWQFLRDCEHIEREINA